MKVTLSTVTRTPRVSKSTGKPFTSIGIKTVEHGAKWLSGFDGPITKDWKNGDVVEINIEQKGEYLNFSVPKAADKLEEALNRITALQMDVKEILSLLKTKPVNVDPKNWDLDEGFPPPEDLPYEPTN